ncbi:MAG: TetR/AcrR family transcriptional regulator [Mycolicibacterium sp.]|nr:TetR/AcrR family transcriptional regulator [Mycolicibacterium sp.]
MPPNSPPLRLRDRTRAALLLAAIDALTGNPAASMSDIATAAGVARSTLNRYFPDRAALTDGIEAYVEAQYEEAVREARTAEGSGLEAYLRIVDEMLERLDSLGWWMRANADCDLDDFDCEADQGIIAVIQRGQRDGTVDSQFTPVFMVGVTWSLLTAAHYDVRHGKQPRRETRDMCRSALTKVARAPEAGS